MVYSSRNNLSLMNGVTLTFLFYPVLISSADKAMFNSMSCIPFSFSLAICCKMLRNCYLIANWDKCIKIYISTLSKRLIFVAAAPKALKTAFTVLSPRHSIIHTSILVTIRWYSAWQWFVFIPKCQSTINLNVVVLTHDDKDLLRLVFADLLSLVLTMSLCFPSMTMPIEAKWWG